MHKATIEDIEAFEYDGLESDHLNGLDLKAMIKFYFQLGPCCIGRKEGKTICIAGYYPVSPGVAQSWLFFNKSAKPHAQEVAEVITGVLEAAMKNEGYHRIQTFVFTGSKDFEKYVEILGFRFESVMAEYGPNREDMSVYRMIKK